MKMIFIIFVYVSMLYCEVLEGMHLYTTMNQNSGTTTFTSQLIDHEGNEINSWEHNRAAASFPYLLPDSTLLYPSNAADPYFQVAASGGHITIYDWNGESLWDYIYSDSMRIQHHDVEPMPNGNILLLCYERISYEEALQAGKTNIDGEIWPDMVVEISPGELNTAEIVWEWRFWDHLIQDVDPTKDNYGVISEHPELLNVNSIGVGGGAHQGHYSGDWLHANSVHYNPILDQIIISSRRANEIYVIDHSTTTEEAAGHSGGLSGKGGDILYRWGNPENYGRGNNQDQKLFHQHTANWIPAGYPGQGNIILYNNGTGNSGGPGWSTVIEIVPPYNGQEYEINNNEAFGPEEPIWSYGDGNFFSPLQSSVFRLPNGNSFICVADEARLIEVNLNGEIEWEWTYQGQGNISRSKKYSLDYLENLLIGDVNSDESLDVLDVILIVNIILTSQDYNPSADLDQNNEIDVLDIIMLINIILN